MTTNPAQIPPLAEQAPNRHAPVNRTRLVAVLLVSFLILLLLVAGVSWWAGRALGRLTGNLPGAAGGADQVQAAFGNLALPAGFSRSLASDVMGMKMVIFNHSDGRSHIHLISPPEWIDVESDAARRSMLESSGVWQGGEMSAPEEVTVAGEPAVLLRTRGVSGDGQPFATATLFARVGGEPVVLIYERPVAAFNEAELAALLASVGTE